eukprot:2997393-Prymnesium_polylepis.1
MKLQEHSAQGGRLAERRPPQLVEPLEALVARVLEVPRLGHREVHVLDLAKIPQLVAVARVEALGRVVDPRQRLPRARPERVQKVLLRKWARCEVERQQGRLHVRQDPLARPQDDQPRVEVRAGTGGRGSGSAAEVGARRVSALDDTKAFVHLRSSRQVGQGVAALLRALGGAALPLGTRQGGRCGEQYRADRVARVAGVFREKLVHVAHHDHVRVHERDLLKVQRPCAQLGPALHELRAGVLRESGRWRLHLDAAHNAAVRDELIANALWDRVRGHHDEREVGVYLNDRVVQSLHAYGVSLVGQQRHPGATALAGPPHSRRGRRVRRAGGSSSGSDGGAAVARASQGVRARVGQRARASLAVKRFTGPQTRRSTPHCVAWRVAGS